MDSGTLVWTKQWQCKSSFSLPMASCSVAGLDLLEMKHTEGRDTWAHLWTSHYVTEICGSFFCPE